MENLIKMLKEVDDPRQSWKIDYPLYEILTISVLAVICGARSSSQISDFARIRVDWLKQYLPLQNGVAHRLTFERVLSILPSRVFEASFNEIMQRIHKASKGEIVSLDGKKFHSSRDAQGKLHALYVVSAWCNENQAVLGQLRISEKTNEITAIPELLKFLDIKGATVTTDAIGCQTEIVRQIVKENKADYCIALKENQPALHKAMTEYAEFCLAEPLEKGEYTQLTTFEKGHGRIEKRVYTYFGNLYWYEDKQKWAALRGMIRVDSTRSVGKAQPTHEARYYITSLPNVELAAHAIRSHWGIENRLHWCLDVIMNEDSWLTRIENEAANLTIIRKMALSFLRKTTWEGAENLSAPRKMFHCALDPSLLDSAIANARFLS